MMVSPTLINLDDYYRGLAAFRREAERQVRKKFPKLLEGSSGWHRAVENRYRRLTL